MSLEEGTKEEASNERLEVPEWLQQVVKNQAQKIFSALREGNPNDLLPALLSSIRELQDVRNDGESIKYINIIKSRWTLLLCALLFEGTINPIQRHMGITSKAMIHALETNYGILYRSYHDVNRQRRAGLTIDYSFGGEYGCFHIPPSNFPRKTNVIIDGISYTITLTIGSAPLDVTVEASGT